MSRKRSSGRIPGGPSSGKPSLAGKNVRFLDDSAKSTPQELRAHLSRFNLTWTLRRIAELNAVVRENVLEVAGITAPAYCLAYLAFVAVEVSTDDVSEWNSPGFVDIPGSMISTRGVTNGETQTTQVYPAVQG